VLKEWESPKSVRKTPPLLDRRTFAGPPFYSKNEPGQWVCWDFREMRVRLTHYTLSACKLKSWVVEASVDGSSWTQIDRQTDSRYFTSWGATSFSVSATSDFRLIRLTQTGLNHSGCTGPDQLCLGAVEFFGTLSE
jgi:hypothetical protein